MLPAWRYPTHLITPHGDQEPGRGFTKACTPALPHYPSWGSGTRQIGQAHAQQLGLITPHGDQEQHRRPADEPRRHNSLPLMGIRNSVVQGSSSTSCVSLPLRGIRNSVVQGSSSTSCVSLPLRGIRNAHRPIPPVQLQSSLITPQGDQEPTADSAPAPLLDSPHYPSWGSGTSALVGGFAALRPVSLPLRGIRNQSVDLPTRGGVLSSLPLMGIRNRPDRSACREWQELSLPLMGIRNPISDFPPVPSRTSHYPSWGSEPPGPLSLQEWQELSLPLMGIRNAPARSRLGCRGKLITPHGDQERRAAPA